MEKSCNIYKTEVIFGPRYAKIFADFENAYDIHFKERKEKPMERLVDYIGEPALLEQVAEECNELSFACLKLARMMRGENKVHGRTKQGLIDNVHEEIADVLVSVDELSKSHLIDENTINQWIDSKKRRMQGRLSEENSRKEEDDNCKCEKNDISKKHLTDRAKKQLDEAIGTDGLAATVISLAIAEQIFPGSIITED